MLDVRSSARQACRPAPRSAKMKQRRFGCTNAQVPRRGLLEQLNGLNEVAMSELSEAPLPFWRTKTLEEMSTSEWESLCDGCARCCLVKLEEDESGKIHYTDLSCTLLDG